MVRSYRDLLVWQRAMKLAEVAYDAAAALPRFETFGLASQIRRSAVSVAANVAEGHGRLHRADYVRHLSIARGSLAELQTLLLLAERIHHTTVESPSSLAEETARMLNSLITSLRAR